MSIDIYKRLLQHRQTFKAITQLSWEITQVDKKYPIDRVPEEGLEALEALYQVVVNRFNQLAQENYDNQNQQEV